MYKNILKKAVAVTLSVVSLCSICISGYADTSEICSNKDSGVAPMYLKISTTYTALSRNSNGSLNCDAATTVPNGYNAGVKAELQQYSNGWNTIKTWSDTGSRYATVDNNWFVEDGYSYRLKTTHYAYDSNWKLIESVVKYSNTVR